MAHVQCMKNVKQNTQNSSSKFMYVVLCIIRAVDNNWGGHHFAKEWSSTLATLITTEFEIHLLSYELEHVNSQSYCFCRELKH